MQLFHEFLKYCHSMECALHQTSNRFPLPAAHPYLSSTVGVLAFSHCTSLAVLMLSASLLIDLRHGVWCPSTMWRKGLDASVFGSTLGVDFMTFVSDESLDYLLCPFWVEFLTVCLFWWSFLGFFNSLFGSFSIVSFGTFRVDGTDIIDHCRLWILAQSQRFFSGVLYHKGFHHGGFCMTCRLTTINPKSSCVNAKHCSQWFNRQNNNSNRFFMKSTLCGRKWRLWSQRSIWLTRSKSLMHQWKANSFTSFRVVSEAFHPTSLNS
jgi:hypothetical protein